jgi:hypothetical protein
MPYITIGEKEILSGIASSQESSNGIFDPDFTYGIDPFKRLATYGQIRRGYAPTDLTGSVVKDTIVNFVFNADYFSIGNTGYLYQTTGTLGATTTELNSADRAGRAGLTYYNVFNHHNGTANLLHYIYGTKIGTFDYSTTFTADVYTGLQSAPHPTKEFDGKTFIGNGRYVAKLDATTLTLQALTLPIGYEVQDIEVYNNYLAVLAFRNLGSLNVECKIFIWDTYSSATQWQAEYVVKERALALDLYKGDLVVFGDNVRLFNGGSLDILHKIGSGSVISFGNTFSGDNTVYWQENGNIKAYGTPNGRLSPCLFSPIGGCGKGGAIIRTDNSLNHFLISRNDNLLYYYKGNDTASNSVAKTVNLDMPRSTVKSIQFDFDVLADGDAVLINVYNDRGQAILAESLSFSTYGALNTLKKIIYSKPTSFVNIEISYNSRAGDIIFRNIRIEYEPTRLPS